MIQVADNFNYRGKKPNFDRDSFDTLQDMKNYSENSLDDGHISYCKDNNIDNLPINASSTFKYFVYNSQTKKLNYRYGDNLYTINSTIITENNQRPSLSNIDKGTMYFDTAINKPIFWDGSKWIDATGATV